MTAQGVSVRLVRALRGLFGQNPPPPIEYLPETEPFLRRVAQLAPHYRTIVVLDPPGNGFPESLQARLGRTYRTLASDGPVAGRTNPGLRERCLDAEAWARSLPRPVLVAVASDGGNAPAVAATLAAAGLRLIVRSVPPDSAPL